MLTRLPLNTRVSIIVAIVAIAGAGYWTQDHYRSRSAKIELRRKALLATVEAARETSVFYVNGGTTREPYGKNSLILPRQFQSIWMEIDHDNVEIRRLKDEFQYHCDTALIAAQMSNDGPTREWSGEMEKRLIAAFH